MEVIIINLFEWIFIIVLGSLFVYAGWKIWKKEQITIIHDYHYTKVKEEDKKPYTEKMGKSVILMGIGMYLYVVIDFVFNTLYSLVAFVICFVVALIIMVLAQIKYNHGIF